jgi:hypothetical protein
VRTCPLPLSIIDTVVQFIYITHPEIYPVGISIGLWQFIDAGERSLRMWARSVCVLLVIAGFILGCAGSAKKLNNVKLGMTRAEVVEVMGEPNYISSRENVELLNYKLTSYSIFTDEYFVRLRDGKVDLFGQRGDFGVIY